MKLVFIVLFSILVGLALYAYSENQEMHENLSHQLMNDVSIVAEAGKIISYDYLRSWSCTENEGDCRNTYWEFGVTGEKKCILVDVVLRERFPNYHVVSVRPSYHLTTQRSDGEVVYEKNTKVSKCPSRTVDIGSTNGT